MNEYLSSLRLPSSRSSIGPGPIIRALALVVATSATACVNSQYPSAEYPRGRSSLASEMVEDDEQAEEEDAYDIPPDKQKTPARPRKSFNSVQQELGDRLLRSTIELYIQDNRGRIAQCSGVIVSPRTFLTVTHCLENGFKKISIVKYDVGQNGGVDTTAPATYSSRDYRGMTFLDDGSDYPVAVTFSQPVFNIQRVLPIQNTPLQSGGSYCAGHVRGYGPRKVWRLDAGRIWGISDEGNIYMDMPRVQYGNSGGGIVNCETGELVGILTQSNGENIRQPFVPPPELIQLMRKAEERF